MAEGLYRDRRRLVIAHRGTAQKAVVIRAESGARVVLQRPDSRQNTINVVGGQHLILRGLEISGGSSGIRMMKSENHACQFVTIEGMHIHDIGGAAVTANNEGNAYEGLILRNNHIYRTSGHGEGFYLGSNNGPDGATTGYVFNSLIEGNYIHHLNGPKVSQGDGIEIKDGSYNNIVRDNVIHDTKYPGIVVFGADGKQPNLIERNVIWSSGDHGIQAAADAIVRNNLVFNIRNNGIHSQNHQSAMVGQLDIRHNTIVCNHPGSIGIRCNLRKEGKTSNVVTIANNAIYAFGEGNALKLPKFDAFPQQLTLAGNRGSGRIHGLPSPVLPEQWNPNGDLARDLDRHLFPIAGSSLIGAADSRFMVSDDFNRNNRGSARDTGAFRFSSTGNPGWPIGPGFKQFPLSPN